MRLVNNRYYLKFRFFLLFLTISALLTCLLLAPNIAVYALDSNLDNPKGLTLSPLRSELDIMPGTSLSGVLLITNSTDKAMVVDMSAEEFSVFNQQYDYAFTAESDTARWVSFDSTELSLPAGESVEVGYAVGVPVSAEPGGRYISLFASTDTGAQVGDIKSRQRIASMLYITVIGDVTRSGNLVSLSSPWVVGGESEWGATIQNTGSTHFRSRYNIQIKNLIGSDVITRSSGNALILPGTIRAVSDKLPMPKIPGLYKVVYVIGLGDTPAVTETRFLLYIPPIAMFAFFMFIALIVFALSRKRLRKV
jgi:hypothetical protein